MRTNSRLQVIKKIIQLEIGNALVTICLLEVPSNSQIKLEISGNSPIILNIKALDGRLRIRHSIRNRGCESCCG